MAAEKEYTSIQCAHVYTYTPVPCRKLSKWKQTKSNQCHTLCKLTFNTNLKHKLREQERERDDSKHFKYRICTIDIFVK